MAKNISISRRDFLSNTGKTLSTTATIQALSTLGIALSSAACGSSSAEPNQTSNVSNAEPRLKSPRPEDWPLEVGVGKHVLILGAGMAGLVSAYELEKLGYSCTMLEATERVGGRVRTIRSGDVIEETNSSQICQFDADPSLYFNAGAARIPHHHDLVLGYCREFGIALEAFINENKAARYHSTSSFNGSTLLARQVTSDSQGYIGELLAASINQGSLDSQLTQPEKNNLLSVLQQFSSLDNNFQYQGSSRTGFEGQENAGSRNRDLSVSPIPRRELFESKFWQFKVDFFKGIDQQSTMFQPVEGMDTIPLAFELAISNSVIYNAKVSQIRKNSNGVRVTYIDHLSEEVTIDADYCICTIPATVLKDIPNDFSTSHQNEIQNFSYSKAGKLAFQSNRFWESEHNIYGGISWTDQDITQIWYPSNNFMSNQGIILGAYTFGSAQGDRFASQTPSERINSGLAQGDAIHSQYSTAVSNGISISWPNIPYQLGGWGISQPNVLLTEDENIFFAGEHLSILQGWQEGAILSAYSAIDLIVEKDLVE